MLLEDLADALARDQKCLDGLGQAPPASGPDSARLIVFKRKYRGLAASVLPSLAAPAGDATSYRAGIQTRCALLLRMQALESSIDAHIVHSSAAALRTARDDGPPRSVAAPGVRELPEGAVRAGTGEVIAPPEFVTLEHALRLDINRSII